MGTTEPTKKEPILLFANPRDLEGIQIELLEYMGHGIANRLVEAGKVTNSPCEATDQDLVEYLRAGNEPAAILVSYPYRSVISKIKELDKPMCDVPIILYGMISNLDGKVLGVPTANQNKDGEIARVLKETLSDKL